jgi:ATP-dependent HslUV protease, peptidase subunit HslV
MTTIAAIRAGNSAVVHLCSDKMLSSDSSFIGMDSKLIIVPGTFETGETCIAVSGPRTAYHALKSCLNESHYNWDTTQNVYESVTSLHAELREHHGLVVKESEDDMFESSQYQAVIANNIGLWMVLSTREVIEYKDSFCAIGSGREYAMGAMDTTHDSDSHNLVVRRAIATANRFDKSTGKDVELWKSHKNL